MNEKLSEQIYYTVTDILKSIEFRRRIFKELDAISNAGGEYIHFCFYDLSTQIIFEFTCVFGAFCHKIRQKTALISLVKIIVFESAEKQKNETKRIFFIEDVVPSDDSISDRKSKFVIGFSIRCLFASVCPEIHRCKLAREIMPHSEFHDAKELILEGIKKFFGGEEK